MPHHYLARALFGGIIFIGWTVMSVYATVALWRLAKTQEAMARTLAQLAERIGSGPAAGPGG